MRTIKWKSNKANWDYHYYVNIVQCPFHLRVKITFIFLWVQYYITWTAQRRISSGSGSNGFLSILSIAYNQDILFCFIFQLYLSSIFFFPEAPQHLFSLHFFLYFYWIITLNSQSLFEFYQIFPFAPQRPPICAFRSAPVLLLALECDRRPYSGWEWSELVGWSTFPWKWQTWSRHPNARMKRTFIVRALPFLGQFLGFKRKMTWIFICWFVFALGLKSYCYILGGYINYLSLCNKLSQNLVA